MAGGPPWGVWVTRVAHTSEPMQESLGAPGLVCLQDAIFLSSKSLHAIPRVQHRP